MKKPIPRRPLSPSEKAAAEHVLRRRLWTSGRERWAAADVLARGAVTEKQAALLRAAGDRLAMAEAETP
jgi:hypothetical protein